MLEKKAFIVSISFLKNMILFHSLTIHKALDDICGRASDWGNIDENFEIGEKFPIDVTDHVVSLRIF